MKEDMIRYQAELKDRLAIADVKSEIETDPYCRGLYDGERMMMRSFIATLDFYIAVLPKEKQSHYMEYSREFQEIRESVKEKAVV